MRVLAWDATTVAWTKRSDDINEEAAVDSSGSSVALSDDGTVLAVGTPVSTGQVKVLVWDTTTEAWIQRGVNINGMAAGDGSGVSVALSNDGTSLAIGAEYNNGAGFNTGHVRVLVSDATTAVWTQHKEDIGGEATGDQSGWSVALSDDGTVLAVGAHYNDGAGSNAGHVRVFALRCS